MTKGDSALIRTLVISALAGILVQPQDANGQVVAGFTAVWNVYKSVMRGSRLIRDLSEGAGTVTKAISTFDGFLETEPGKFTNVGTDQSTQHKFPDNALQDQSDADEIGSSAFENPTNSLSTTHEVSVFTKNKPKSIGNSDEIDLLAIADGEDVVPVNTANPLEFSSLDTFRSSREGTKAKRRHRRSKTLGKEDKPKVVHSDDRKKSELSGCEIFLSHVNDKQLPVDKMAACCAEHDMCYSSGCRPNKRRCGKKLKSCLFTSCRHRKLRRLVKKTCKSTIKLIHKGTVANSLLENSDVQELHKCQW